VSGVERPGTFEDPGGGDGEDLLRMLEGEDTLGHFNRRIKRDADFCKARWDEAAENHRFVSPSAGAQWEPAEYKARQDDGRPTYSINDVALAVHAVTGQEITGRYQRSFKGRSDEGDHFVAEAINTADRKVREIAMAEHVESEAFRDLAVGGYSWVEWWQDHLEDYRGRTRVRTHDLWNVMWDASARDPMLLDREWDAVGWWESLDECLARYPKQREDLLNHLRQPDGWVTPGSSSQSARWPWLYRATSGQYMDPKRREVFRVDYQWRQRAPLWVAEELDQLTGKTKYVRLLSEDERDEYVDRRKAAEGAEPDMVGPEEGLYRWEYNRAAIVGNKVLKEGPIPEGMFTRICMTGFPEKQMEAVLFHGIVAYMKDPQKFKNAVVSMMTSMLQRSLKGGIFYDPKAFDRPADLARPMSSPYPMIASKSGVLMSGARVWEEIPVKPFPSGLDQFLSMADMAVWRPTGLNPNSLGQLQDPRRVSGVVMDSMDKAGGTVLAYLNNALKMMRQISGRLQLRIFMRYEEDHFREMVGDKLQDAVPPKAEWETFFDRDVVVDEEQATTKDERAKNWDLMSRQGTPEKMVNAGMMPKTFMAKMTPGFSEAERAEWTAWLQQREGLEDQKLQLELLSTQLQIMQTQMQMQQMEQQAAGGAPPAEGGEPPPEGEAPPEEQPQ
jgi:hypothetical protein